MKKKSYEDFGILVTREMTAMLQDESLTKEQRFDCLASIMFGMEVHNTLLASYANSLKVGYLKMNDDRKRKIASIRESKRAYMRGIYKKCASIEDNGIPLGDIPHNTKLNNTSINIPLNPPSGVEGNLPPAISVEDLIAGPEEGSLKKAACDLADAIEASEAFARMRVNAGKLRKCLNSILKKSGGAEKAVEVSAKILAGLREWTVAWKADEWRFVPGKVTDWLYDGKWLEEPRKKEAAPERDLGEVGVSEIV